MELELIRTYFANGTNGVLLLNGKEICATIELPWKNNEHGVSCIPEGRYELKKRYSPRHDWHLLVKDVPGRQWILIHSANYAQKELLGCIAPVTVIAGEGRGYMSKKACQLVYSLAFAELGKNKQVFLTIKSDHHEKNDEQA